MKPKVQSGRVLTTRSDAQPELTPSPLAYGKPQESTTVDLNEIEIRELAFKLYEARGRADGQDVQDWLQAEAIIRDGRK
jgi:hypothetical protein